jgi:hypothetical protein
MRNPFRTLRTHTATIARLEAEISDLKTELAAQAEKIAALVRDDQQIAALRRIQAAVEYQTSAHRHDRQSHGQRHEF